MVRRHVRLILRYSAVAATIGVAVLLAFGFFFWGGPKALAEALFSLWRVFVAPAFWFFRSGAHWTYILAVAFSAVAWGTTIYACRLAVQSLRRPTHPRDARTI